jgi:pilus assembly protein CpaB
LRPHGRRSAIISQVKDNQVMQRRLITVILFALVAALLSSTVLYKVISANASRPTKDLTTQVLVASRDLEAGALVGKGDVQAVEWHSAVSPKWIGRREDIVGRGLVAGINKDEPFPENRLAAKGAGAGLTSRIPSGMRAVAVHVDELSGLNRFIMSGMHVDVISNRSVSEASGQGMVTRTILQNVEVLSTGEDADRGSKDRPTPVQTVNLLVTPQQAEVLSQAVAQNRIQLVLRNPLDQAFAALGLTSDAPTAEKKVVKVARVAPAKPVEKIIPVEQPKPPTVEVIHGTKKVISVVGPADQEPKQ